MAILKIKFSTQKKKKGLLTGLPSLKKKGKFSLLTETSSEFEWRLFSQKDRYYFILNSQLIPIQSGYSIQHEGYQIQFEIEKDFSVENQPHSFLNVSPENLCSISTYSRQETDPLDFLYKNVDFKTLSLPSPTTHLLPERKRRKQQRTRLIQ